MKGITSEDTFFVDYKQFDAINIEEKGKDKDKDKDNKDSGVNMNSIVEATIKLIERKLALNDSILILCFEYCYYLETSKNSNGNNKDDEESLLNRFVNVLQRSVAQCINSKHQNSHTKLRDYQWFKKYLLTSLVWLCQLPNGKLLYDTVEATVDDALLQQKRFIFVSVGEIKKQDGKNWDNIVKFGYGSENVRALLVFCFCFLILRACFVCF